MANEREAQHDEVIRRLTRSDFEEIDAEIVAGHYDSLITSNAPGLWQIAVVQIYDKHGWTEEEYIEEFQRRFPPRDPISGLIGGSKGIAL